LPSAIASSPSARTSSVTPASPRSRRLSSQCPSGRRAQRAGASLQDCRPRCARCSPPSRKRQRRPLDGLHALIEDLIIHLLSMVVMSPVGTSRTSRDVRLESAKGANADIDQIAVANCDFMSTHPSYRRVLGLGSNPCAG